MLFGRFLILLVLHTACSSIAAQPYVVGESYPTADSFHPPVNQPSPRCGRFERDPAGLGPVDYQTVSPFTIAFVEVRHFPRHVETLQRGARSGSVPGDIQYMLITFPNHPRALRAAAELIRRNKGVTPQYMTYGIDCWFDRALAYRPEDPEVRIVYANELFKDGKLAEAREQTLIAESLVKDNPRLRYNLGLLFFDLKDFEKSLANAKVAYTMGFDLPGLRNKLKNAGKWHD
jgi:hypothetical protein